jgi:hypothetical protein
MVYVFRANVAPSQNREPVKKQHPTREKMMKIDWAYLRKG